jgi:hypothetical protein
MDNQLARINLFPSVKSGLVATLFGRAQLAFTLTPDLARQVSELGIAINFEFARG